MSQSQDNEVQFGPLINLDGEDSSPTYVSTGLNGLNVMDSPPHSTPMKYHEIGDGSSPNSQQLMESISELKELVLGVGQQSQHAEDQFRRISARLDQFDSRLSSMEKHHSKVWSHDDSKKSKEIGGEMPILDVDNTFSAKTPLPPSLIPPSPARPKETQAPRKENEKVMGNAENEKKPQS